MEGFDRFQLAGLALICLKNETKADAERDLRDLIFAAGAEVSEKARRERLLRHLESADKAHTLGIGKVQPGASRRVFFGDGHPAMRLGIADSTVPRSRENVRFGWITEIRPVRS